MPATILAYPDRISVRAGDRISIMASVMGARSFRAELVRLLGPDLGPAGPARPELPVAHPMNGEYPAREQPVAIGSWIRIAPHPLLEEIRDFTLQAFIWPTMPGRGTQAIAGTWCEATRQGFMLGVGASGDLELRIGDQRIATGVPLAPRKWHFVAASFDAASGEVRLTQEPLADGRFDLARPAAIVARAAPAAPSPHGFRIAAWLADPDGARVAGHFDGRIERPVLCRRAIDRAAMAALAQGAGPAGMEGEVVGLWDFSVGIDTLSVADVSGNGLGGETINLPTRAVTGHNWTGSTYDWRAAPDQYGAIHFHADDLADCGWTPSFSIAIPDDLRSGCYAAKLSAGDARFYVPFFVRPRRGDGCAKVVFLAPTATYTTYANHRSRFESARTELVHGRLSVLDATDVLLLRFPELGRSGYDHHADGSGMVYATRQRPVTNMKPHGRLWNFCADLLLVHWLENSGVAYDVVTDDDLDAEGIEALRPYRVVVTGTHPEYASRRMLDGLDAFLRQGGRLMYMGGNGFYYRVAFTPLGPGIIELRRSEYGIRQWEPMPGEMHHGFDGVHGGLWRSLGRAPNALTGVGFVAHGFDRSAPYRRTAASRDPRVAFMFEGIDADVLGDFGLCQGGAAGFEIDGVDPLLGTPAHALVVARSFDHSNIYQIAIEEQNILNGATDGRQNARVRADMTFFESGYGGAVFSTASIAFAGSLAHLDYANPIARLAGNVLRRFADPAPFAAPAQIGVS